MLKICLAISWAICISLLKFLTCIHWNRILSKLIVWSGHWNRKIGYKQTCHVRYLIVYIKTECGFRENRSCITSFHTCKIMHEEEVCASHNLLQEEICKYPKQLILEVQHNSHDTCSCPKTFATTPVLKSVFCHVLSRFQKYIYLNKWCSQLLFEAEREPDTLREKHQFAVTVVYIECNVLNRMTC